MTKITATRFHRTFSVVPHTFHVDIFRKLPIEPAIPHLPITSIINNVAITVRMSEGQHISKLRAFKREMKRRELVLLHKYQSL